MAETGENVALVTQTLVGNASTVLTRPDALTLPFFLDLCALCEAVVLLDRLEALDAADERETVLGRRLGGEGLYRTFRPALSADELRRVMLRLPDELAKRITLDAGGPGPTVDATGAVTGLDYTTGLNNLLAQVDALGGYASSRSRDGSVKERMYRGNGYLLVAAAHGLDYFPDFDRVPFVAGTLQKTYRSLPRQLYDKVSESLDEPLNGGDLVAEWAAMSTVPIPPISALVLSRASSLDDVPEQLLRVRDEFRRYRRYFGDFKAALRTADTVRERRKLLARYRTLLAEASGPDRETVSLTEMLNLTEKAVKAAAGPALPTSYGALLVTQPVDWIRRWWQRRPLAILFRLDSKLPRLPEYRRLVGKLWGDEAGHALLGEVAEHGTRLRALMADAEPA
ncbi:hypothetical protein [Amycolatopsis sp. MtRt-6]|uniref:hypothetical protein n=1 Tax=Amycolatopsis sp. MtRt-6 TaxID=2792782 RepID=UPI001A900E9C|nr:hypothetical protein [Amycolatopsis sp. MtRt-6]